MASVQTAFRLADGLGVRVEDIVSGIDGRTANAEPAARIAQILDGMSAEDAERAVGVVEALAGRGRCSCRQAAYGLIRSG